MTRAIITAPDGAYVAHFDLAKASRWDDRDPVTGSGCGGAGRGEAILLTASGRWLLERWTDWGGEASVYSCVSEQRARAWLLRHDFTGAAAEHFGPDEDDRRPGRPEIGGRVNIHLGDLLAKVDAARLPGESLAAAVRRLLAAALGDT